MFSMLLRQASTTERTVFRNVSDLAVQDCMSGKITFKVEQCDIFSQWGETFKVGAWFEVPWEGNPRVYVKGPVDDNGTGAIPIYDYMGGDEDPSFWVKIGFTARDESGNQLHWTDDGWRYKEHLPTRLELLMKT